MNTVVVPAPAVFIVSNAIHKSGDDETDKSLLFACTPDPRTSACINAFKGLGLAVRGVLGSICGEKTSAIQLRQQQGGIAILAFAHLQKCMVVLALPGSIPADLTGQLALHLVHAMVVLAGPSNAWLVPDLTVGTRQPIVLKPKVQVLFELVCNGVLRQIEGAGWARAQPSLLCRGAVMRLRLQADRQRALDALLASHQAGAARNLEQGSSPHHHHHQPGAHTPSAQQPLFQFYQRHCCLLHKGLLVSSGLPPQHSQLVWQLCWCLQLFGQKPGAECKVITHKVYMAAPGWEPSCGEVPRGSQRCLLVLVVAGSSVLAVLLQAYDEEIEDELAGKLEGQAAVELLQQVHHAFAGELERAVSGSLLLRSVAQPPEHASAAGGAAGEEAAPAMTPSKAKRAGMASGGSMFARLLLTRARSRERALAASAERAGDSVTGGSSEALVGGSANYTDRSRGLTLLRASSSMRGGTSPPAALMVYQPSSSSLTCLSGDLPTASPAFATEVWSAIADCRAQFGRGQQLAVAPPPKHSRLCLTLGQIERQSALRAPREGGQRLGSADPAPWQYHPELASLATVQQVTLQLHTPVGAGAVAWFVTGRQLGSGCELFCVHSADTDEGEALDAAARDYECLQ